MKVMYKVKAWVSGSGWSYESELETDEVSSIEDFRCATDEELFGWYLDAEEDLDALADDSDGDLLLVAELMDEDGEIVESRDAWASSLAADRIAE